MVENLCGPLTFHHNCQFQSWNQTAAEGVTSAHFRAAALLVIATLDHGYFRNKTEPLLAAPEWAELACAVVAATGRGYTHSHKADDPDGPYTDRLAGFDTATDNSKFPFDTLFHRLGATAKALQTYVEGDDQVANWLRDTEDETIDLLWSLAVKHVEEALTTWESLEVTCIANLMLPYLLQQAKETNFTKLQHLALEMGFELTPASHPPALAPADSGPPTQPPPHKAQPHTQMALT